MDSILAALTIKGGIWCDVILSDGTGCIHVEMSGMTNHTVQFTLTIHLVVGNNACYGYTTAQ